MLANDEISPGTKEQFTRQKLFRKDDAIAHCLFCDEPATYSKPLHNAATLDLDTRVRQCAVNLQDQRLLARLSGGDLPIAIGAEYYSQCLVSLYNRDRDKTSTSHDDCDMNTAKRTAFAELISYIQAALEEEDTSPVFQLSVSKKLCVDRVDQLGEDAVIHSTRLKEKILSYFPHLDAYNGGQNVLLVAKENVGKSLRSCQLDDDCEVVHLSRAANIVREDMLRKKRTIQLFIRRRLSGTFRASIVAYAHYNDHVWNKN